MLVCRSLDARRGTAARVDDTPPRHIVPICLEGVTDTARARALDVIGDRAIGHHLPRRYRLDDGENLLDRTHDDSVALTS